MADLNFNGKSHQVGAPKAFPAPEPGGREYSMDAADHLIDGADYKLVDGLILSDGVQNYVVKKKGLNPDLAQEVEMSRYGDKPVMATLDGKQMKVVKVLDAPDTFREKVSYWSTMLPLMFRSMVSQALGRGNGFS